MSPVLPFDIISLIVDDIAGENNDTNFLTEVALVSHSFHQSCSKIIFSTVEVHDILPKLKSSTERFVKLLESSPDIVKYIRKLTYNTNYEFIPSSNPPQAPSPSFDSSPIPNLLRTISCLNYLKIDA